MSDIPPPRHYDLSTAAHDYPAWNGLPRRTILICSQPRSGSTLLGEALYFAGGLGCPLEYFHSGFRPSIAERWSTPSIRDYIDAVGRYRTDPGGVLAVKLFWRDIKELAEELGQTALAAAIDEPPGSVAPETYRELGSLLAGLFPNATLVHLSRRDRLRRAVSASIAEQTGKWRAIPASGETPPRAEPRFDRERIEAMMANADFSHGHWRNFFAAQGDVPYRLTYEDLARDYAGSVSGLLRHLGSDASPPPIRMRRQADARSEDFVLRYLRGEQGDPPVTPVSPVSPADPDGD